MKKTPLTTLPHPLPEQLCDLIRGARIYDSSSSKEARVYFIDRDGGYYLKRSPKGTLEREAKMTRYYHALALGPEVLYYATDGDCDLLLSAALAGEDATHPTILENPRRLAERMGEELRRLHEMPSDACPVKDRTAQYLRTVEEGYALGRFDPSYAIFRPFRTPTEAIECVRAGANALQTDVLLHGDFCLPNMLFFPDLRLSGFIDVGFGGIGDRHIDLFWGAWSLSFNLHTDAYRDRFFDAYGRDHIQPDLLDTVAAAECFG